MPKITIKTENGDRTITTIWKGRNLAVHRKICATPEKGEYLSRTACSITHIASGLTINNNWWFGDRNEAVTIAQEIDSEPCWQTYQLPESVAQMRAIATTYGLRPGEEMGRVSA